MNVAQIKRAGDLLGTNSPMLERGFAEATKGNMQTTKSHCDSCFLAVHTSDGKVCIPKGLEPIPESHDCDITD